MLKVFRSRFPVYEIGRLAWCDLTGGLADPFTWTQTQTHCRAWWASGWGLHLVSHLLLSGAGCVIWLAICFVCRADPLNFCFWRHCWSGMPPSLFLQRKREFHSLPLSWDANTPKLWSQRRSSMAATGLGDSLSQSCLLTFKELYSRQCPRCWQGLWCSHPILRAKAD